VVEEPRETAAGSGSVSPLVLSAMTPPVIADAAACSHRLFSI
jgi:hypothetical protein